jgi:hypothetical protein
VDILADFLRDGAIEEIDALLALNVLLILHKTKYAIKNQKYYH